MGAMNIKDIKNNTDYTKQICYYTFFAIVLIIIFIVSPLNKFVLVSKIVKIVILIILGYTVYLNYNQTNMLKGGSSNNGKEFLEQLNTNIIASYVFTAFLAILIIFVIKSLIN
jgi:glucan phosphoethanolaminetransferase (alkaline phosphatase superfamily)